MYYLRNEKILQKKCETKCILYALENFAIKTSHFKGGNNMIRTRVSYQFSWHFDKPPHQMYIYLVNDRRFQFPFSWYQ